MVLLISVLLSSEPADGPLRERQPDGELINEELAAVRKYLRGEMATEIFGRIAPNAHAELIDYVLLTKTTRPLSGVTIVGEGQGTAYRAVSDASGE